MFYWIVFLSFLHFVAVKFLREVTPYFRKASIISEVGWELQRAFLCPLSTTTGMMHPNGSNVLSTSSTSMSPPSAPKSPPRADTRYIPLQLTHLARNLKYHDPGKHFPFFPHNNQQQICWMLISHRFSLLKLKEFSLLGAFFLFFFPNFFITFIFHSICFGTLHARCHFSSSPRLYKYMYVLKKKNLSEAIQWQSIIFIAQSNYSNLF